MVAQNAAEDDPADEFDDNVVMWVYEEEYQGRKLTQVGGWMDGWMDGCMDWWMGS
jgi:hypothetical protein